MVFDAGFVQIGQEFAEIEPFWCWDNHLNRHMGALGGAQWFILGVDPLVLVAQDTICEFDPKECLDGSRNGSNRSAVVEFLFKSGLGFCLRAKFGEIEPDYCFGRCSASPGVSGSV